MCKHYFQANGIALCCVFLLNSGWTFCKCGQTKRQYRLILKPDRRLNCPFYNKKIIPKRRSSRECCRGLLSIASMGLYV